MGFAELKSQLEQLPRDELMKALAFLKLRLRRDDPANQQELARFHSDLEQGQGVPLAALRRHTGDA